jgi:hypothetical protein
MVMAQHANAVHTSSRPASRQPKKTIQSDTPDEFNVWLFVSLVPITFIAIVVALALTVPH